jgi:hypothetical protein
MKEMMGEVEKWKSEKVGKKESALPEIRFLLKKGPKKTPADLDLRALKLDEIEREIDKEMRIGPPEESDEKRIRRR